MALIELEQIGRRFGNHVALHDVTLRLEAGRIGLLGPNGAGKSTLLKILMGLLQPTEGRGRLMDVDIRRGGIQLRRLIGYMSEADALVPGLRGAEYVALAGQLYGMPRGEAHRRAHEVLTYLGLEEARYRRLEEYSTGMKQRLKLAQALVHDPPLLFLDEPTSGLDPAGRDAMLRLLLTLGREHGKSFILSTHLLNDVERVCETVVILYRGRVIEQGRTEELRTSRYDRYRLQVEGKLGGLVDDLRAEGVQVLSATRGRRAVSLGPEIDAEIGENGRLPVSELIVLVPQDWRTRLFFTLADNRGVVIRGLQRDDEDLEQIFHRKIQETGTTEAVRHGAG
ncbi:MAG: ABC transporter ATP-binding protein [Gemmatales bacterium]|nr:ABC transporter ATP-binding protein [Gemmatales bacterium]MDW8388291.1 ABC transporter ATP-binding protein [Gemmatales bacterium]